MLPKRAALLYLVSSLSTYLATRPELPQNTCSASSPAIAEFRAVAQGDPHRQVTDKVNGTGRGVGHGNGKPDMIRHRYELMYGIFLMPLRNSPKPIRMLEIGLGCYMGYGPGASARLWRRLLPNADIWEAEFDGACVTKYAPVLEKMRTRPLVGSQRESKDLDAWVRAVGNDLDVVIDDGDHRSKANYLAFQALWPAIAPGGLYFIEDLMMNRKDAGPDVLQNGYTMIDVLMSWMDQLTVYRGPRYAPFGHHAQSAPNKEAAARAALFPLPDRAAFVFCQDTACVVGKESKGVLAGASH
jgi:hypothetical protein